MTFHTKELIEAGRDFYRRGWSLGTSSNYSAVVSRDPLQLVLTASGFDKGNLTAEQFVVVDGNGNLAVPSEHKPSAETALHTVLARVAGAGAILHTHSAAATVLSKVHRSKGFLEISGYEMLKGLSGIKTHETTLNLVIFPNTQDIEALAQEVEVRLLDAENPLRHGFLLSGHGLYTWGRDVAEARRHVEVLEFLLDVTLQSEQLVSHR
ncbi:MAG: methylthioribulose 1-phosphate dehydratase [Verrucomicrobia bacterium]|nr:methylthioribulose 1-phosphate dehydratase [Verrucomicrobiota bacterium]